jgi:transposase InsO family protein
MPRKCPSSTYRMLNERASRSRLGNIRHRIATSSAPRSCCTPPRGLENDEIAARLDTPRQIVSKWRKRFFRERLRGLEERSRTGRPGAERSQILAHALCQGFMKRGLPASGYHDNGKAMISTELKEGLTRLGLVDANTMAYSAYMNGKIEVLWEALRANFWRCSRMSAI